MRPPGPELAYANYLGISKKRLIAMGGAEYLRSLDALTRRVLLNAAHWQIGRPSRVPRKRPNSKPKPVMKVTVEQMMELSERLSKARVAYEAERARA